jgi:hypothetical protein
LLVIARQCRFCVVGRLPVERQAALLRDIRDTGSGPLDADRLTCDSGNSSAISWTLSPPRDPLVLQVGPSQPASSSPCNTNAPEPAGSRALDNRHEAGCGVRTESLPLLAPSWLEGQEVIFMAMNRRQTGAKAASQASKVLSNPKSTKAEKGAAASALSQTPRKGK